MNEQKCGLNGFAIKMIAVVTMLTDHIGAILYPELTVLRIIGRIAFPIFCFLLAEGFLHTRNVKRYLLRMFLFALISEIPFDLAFSGKWFDPESQNVYWTLFLGLLMLYLMQKAEKRFPVSMKMICDLLILLVFCIAAEYLEVDYHLGGMLIIFIFYYFRGGKGRWIGYVLCALVLIFFYGGIEPWAVIGFVPMLLYNGRRGPSAKWVFYLFYPCHILVLYFIGLVI